jgi:hypothetical protein
MTSGFRAARRIRRHPGNAIEEILGPLGLDQHPPTLPRATAREAVPGRAC